MGVAGVSAQGRVQAHLGLFQVLAFGADTGLPPYHQLSDLQSEGFSSLLVVSSLWSS